MCDQSSRVLEFTAWLKSKRLWPFSQLMLKNAYAILHRLSDKPLETLNHACEGRAQCPLMLQAVSLKDKVALAVEEADVLKLSSYRVLP